MRTLCLALLLAVPAVALAQSVPTSAAIDAELREVMRLTGARGLGLAVVRDGQVTEVRAQGVRNAAGDPLQIDTVMYGASLTKAAFAYTVMQLVEEGRTTYAELFRVFGEG